jgi:hypothetical protein
MLFQQNVDAAGNRVYGIFLYVVMTDNELQERTWTRDIRYLQFVILNSEGRQLKDKTTVALYRENQLSWGFPGLLDNSILLRDPVVNNRRTIDIVCRLRYHPNQEKLRRPLSPSISGSLLASQIIGKHLPTSHAVSTPTSFWDQQKNTTAVDSVGKHLKKLLNSGDFSDLEIVVGREGHVLQAHKAILAARSDWFRSALRPGFREAREGRITLLEDDPKIFESLLEFLYTGEYPLLNPESNPRPIPPKHHDAMHFSPRSPPTIPPRVTEETSPATSNSFAEKTPVAEEATFDYLNQFDTESDAADDVDEQKFQLFLMADKYGVTELKTLIRLHLTNDLLDTSSNTHPGQRLLRLVRFAFEELPESTRSANRTPSGRDSGVGSSVANPMSERGASPINMPNGYAFGAAGTNVFSFSDLDNREETASVFGHSTEGSDVRPTMIPEPRRSISRVSHSSNSREEEHGGIYGRDNETNMLRGSITAYVAKMFHAVRQLEGFEELLREGGEMGGFVKMVMDSMYRP